MFVIRAPTSIKPFSKHLIQIFLILLRNLLLYRPCSVQESTLFQTLLSEGIYFYIDLAQCRNLLLYRPCSVQKSSFIQTLLSSGIYFYIDLSQYRNLLFSRPCSVKESTFIQTLLSEGIYFFPFAGNPKRTWRMESF